MESTTGVTVTAVPAVEPETDARLRAFLDASAFSSRGGIVTDLDGTVVFEFQGTTLLAPEVEAALHALYALGRPLIINSLRFPLSVLRSFAVAWHRISNAPIPTVSLNGSQIGLVHVAANGEPHFEELDAFPLSVAEGDAVLARVEALMDAGIDHLLLFRYPRDWRQGEIVWTPRADRMQELVARYPSAAAVESAPLAELRARLAAEPHCMLFLLVEAPEDRLMAYQHTRRSNFFTCAGIDKLSGAAAMAARLGIELRHSIGAGDTEMDRFLAGVGLALHVGPLAPVHAGLVDTIRLRDAGALAAVLYRIVALERARG
jgi:hydroxymethylpyrimidine pyrophosphatase-like HAD family hydrolase